MLICAGSGSADMLLMLTVEAVELAIPIDGPAFLDSSCCELLAIWSQGVCVRRGWVQTGSTHMRVVVCAVVVGV